LWQLCHRLGKRIAKIAVSGGHCGFSLVTVEVLLMLCA
jgi:hypothetical protein